MKNIMFLTKYPIGKKLLIELKGGQCFEGICYLSNEKQISLNNIEEFPSGIKEESILHFYSQEIESVTVIEYILPFCTNPKNALLINELILNKLKILSKHFIYLPIVDSDYFKAIDDINLFTKIAIYAIDSAFGRNRLLSVFTVATNEKCYIFDLKIGHSKDVFKNGLKQILESEEIIKIVYDSKRLSDCLFHLYDVNIENIFDVQVADYLLSEELSVNSPPNNMKSLSQCLKHYLNIPECVLHLEELSTEKLSVRPLTNEKKCFIVFPVACNYVLNNVIEKKMLRNFYVK